MKVLLLGATGNLGLRLIPALLTHSHTVVAYVRSANKLESLLPPSVFKQLTVVEGNLGKSADSAKVKRAILEHGCDGVVSAAGLAKVAPWSKGDLPAIFHSIVDGVREAGEERKKPLRAWFLGGQGVLYYPGTTTMLSNYIPIFLEHRTNITVLRSLPASTISWSMLCPQTMTPESSDLDVPTKPSVNGKLVVNAQTPPLWRESWVTHIPLLGKFLTIAMNASRYTTTLEQNAEFIATDLESGESRFEGVAVGGIDAKM